MYHKPGEKCRHFFHLSSMAAISLWTKGVWIIKVVLYLHYCLHCTASCCSQYCIAVRTGHTLGTSLFSPPPSSTSQHGIFVNSPTTTGKVAFPSVFPAVGSGLQYPPVPCDEI